MLIITCHKYAFTLKVETLNSLESTIKVIARKDHVFSDVCGHARPNPSDCRHLELFTALASFRTLNTISQYLQ